MASAAWHVNASEWSQRECPPGTGTQITVKFFLSVPPSFYNRQKPFICRQEKRREWSPFWRKTQKTPRNQKLCLPSQLRPNCTVKSVVFFKTGKRKFVLLKEIWHPRSLKSCSGFPFPPGLGVFGCILTFVPQEKISVFDKIPVSARTSWRHRKWSWK